MVCLGVGVLLQAAYRRTRGVSVPSPADGDTAVPWWWDHLAAQANALRLAGFTAVLLPPVLKTASGAQRGADAYGPFDDYDIGSKNQKSSTPTRFGSREQLRRCVAMMRANGLDVYLDMVPHQRSGRDNFVYRYPGAGGTPGIGRFPKNKLCFVPNVPRDPIAGPVQFDFAFGDELAPINARPPGYVMHGLIDAGDSLTRSLDVQGYRVDDVKGLAVEFVHTWLTSKGDGDAIRGWRVLRRQPTDAELVGLAERDDGPVQRVRFLVFDFSLRFMLATMCNNSSRWDMSQLDHAGPVGISPANAVTFIDNHDTDLSFPVIWNKLLGYAYILTSEGYPCVSYRDYSNDHGCCGLKPAIDNLIWIHENLAFGSTVARFKDFRTIVYERQGARGGEQRPVPRVANADGQDVVRAKRRPARVHRSCRRPADRRRRGGDDRDPANDNGTGYVAYSRTGFGRPFAVLSHRTMQTFAGAADLDIGPVTNVGGLDVGRIWCAADSSIEATLKIDPAPWGTATQLQLEVLGADGTAVLRVAGPPRRPRRRRPAAERAPPAGTRHA